MPFWSMRRRKVEGSEINGTSVRDFAISSDNSTKQSSDSAGDSSAEADTEDTRLASRLRALRSRYQYEEHRYHDRRQRISTATGQESRANDDIGNELAALAKLRVEALLYLSGPCGKERDPEGYVTRHEYRFREMRISKYESRYVPVVSHRLVEIETLPDIEQNCVYENALYQATVPEVREQYKLHIKRLENIRNNILKFQDISRRDQRLGNIDYDAWCCFSSQLNLCHLVAIAQRAQQVYQEAQVWFDERICGRTAENGVIRLLERCEKILKKADQDFVPKTWRSSSQGFKKRWADGRKGWTGLEI